MFCCMGLKSCVNRSKMGYDSGLSCLMCVMSRWILMIQVSCFPFWDHEVIMLG